MAAPTTPALTIPPRVERQAAIREASGLARSWIGRLTAGSRRVVSSELAYLPFWCHDFAIALSAREPSVGRVAVETRARSTAIVPRDIALERAKPGSKLLPPAGEPDLEAARRAIWFEALAKERRRQEIVVEVGEARLLFVPFWVVYLRGREVDAMAVDETTGKVDLTLKEPLIAALLEAQAGTTQAKP